MATSTLNQSELGSLESLLSSYITSKTSLALSSLLGESVGHSIKKTYTEYSMKNLEGFLDDLVLCSVFLQGGGDIRLGILYSISEPDAKKIAARLLCIDKVDSLDDLGRSAISEVGNIMSGSFFNALSDHTGLKVDLSTPGFSMTSVSELLGPHASGFLSPVNDILTQVEITGSDSGVCVHMLIIQDHENARKLLNSKM